MTDLHTHILPGIDDGAKDLTESIALIKREISDGVDTIVLTPHYRTGMVDTAEFLIKRKHSHSKLADIAKDLPVKFLLGAEVGFTADLPEMDLDQLCIEGTRILLLELPASHYPHLARDVFYKLCLKNYTPLLAHVERYPYVMREPEKMLSAFIESGAYTQINAGSLLNDSRTRRKVLKLISRNLVHVIATDTHSMDKRPPELGKAMAVVRKKLGEDTVNRMVENAMNIAADEAWLIQE